MIGAITLIAAEPQGAMTERPTGVEASVPNLLPFRS